ncbi:hypothetical protein AV545_04215 [Paenibacillus jamilae]|nr:hypothetical protein AV545_04215 [Paenibacillus jamilae]
MKNNIGKRVEIVKDMVSSESESKLIGLTGCITESDGSYYTVQLKGFGRQLKPEFHSTELKFL